MSRFDINKLWYRFFGIGIFITFLLLVFVDKSLSQYYLANWVKSPNLSLLPFVLVVVLLLTGINYFYSKSLQNKGTILSDKIFYIIITVCFVAVLFLQLFIANNIYFRPGWDANTVLTAAENPDFLSSRGEIINSEWYYKTFPNNVAITYLLAILCKFGEIVFPNNPYFFVLYFNVFIVCFSAYLAILCVYKITNNKAVTLISMAFVILLTCLSPWIVIAYTDTIAMPFVTFAVFVYLFIKNKYFKYPLIFASGIVGYFIKPTVIIVLIALVIIDGYELIKKAIDKKLNYRRVVSLFLVIVATVVCVFGAKKIAFSNHDEIFNGEQQFTITHYLMMGLNDDCDGVFCMNDVVYSSSFEDVQSRTDANLLVAKERVGEMGILGTAKLMIKKHILNYNDASFSWGHEGGFYLEHNNKTDDTSTFLKRIFYTQDAGGIYFDKFVTYEQSIWLIILLGMSFCVLYKGKNKHTVALISLTLIGVSLFLMIFECRARYIYFFTPLFIVMFGVGIKSLTDFASENIEKIRNKKRSTS